MYLGMTKLTERQCDNVLNVKLAESSKIPQGSWESKEIYGTITINIDLNEKFEISKENKTCKLALNQLK